MAGAVAAAMLLAPTVLAGSAPKCPRSGGAPCPDNCFDGAKKVHATEDGGYDVELVNCMDKGGAISFISVSEDCSSTWCAI